MNTTEAEVWVILRPAQDPIQMRARVVQGKSGRRYAEFDFPQRKVRREIGVSAFFQRDWAIRKLLAACKQTMDSTWMRNNKYYHWSQAALYWERNKHILGDTDVLPEGGQDRVAARPAAGRQQGTEPVVFVAPWSTQGVVYAPFSNATATSLVFQSLQTGATHA